MDVGTLIAIAVVPLLAWNARVLWRVQSAVFGADGTNGLNGRVKALDRERESQALTIANLNYRVGLAEGELSALRTRLDRGHP